MPTFFLPLETFSVSDSIGAADCVQK
eukprot:SAG31_NODE_11407_length_1034_cov_1.471658_1_plen_25_part_10